ncbi:MAG: hypothetical protein MZW92_70065 [Comamonadaceae bacterium]|nr:hypothetical protein [Comamonadaceae bacterium]
MDDVDADAWRSASRARRQGAGGADGRARRSAAWRCCRTRRARCSASSAYAGGRRAATGARDNPRPVTALAHRAAPRARPTPSRPSPTPNRCRSPAGARRSRAPSRAPGRHRLRRDRLGQDHAAAEDRARARPRPGAGGRGLIGHTQPRRIAAAQRGQAHRRGAEHRRWARWSATRCASRTGCSPAPRSS